MSRNVEPQLWDQSWNTSLLSTLSLERFSFEVGKGLPWDPGKPCPKAPVVYAAFEVEVKNANLRFNLKPLNLEPENLKP